MSKTKKTISKEELDKIIDKLIETNRNNHSTKFVNKEEFEEIVDLNIPVEQEKVNISLKSILRKIKNAINKTKLKMTKNTVVKILSEILSFTVSSLISLSGLLSLISIFGAAGGVLTLIGSGLAVMLGGGSIAINIFLISAAIALGSAVILPLSSLTAKLLDDSKIEETFTDISIAEDLDKITNLHDLHHCNKLLNAILVQKGLKKPENIEIEDGAVV